MNNKYQHDCEKCKTKCDGISKGKYLFTSDVSFSEHFENLLIKRIIEEGYWAKKTIEDGYPDIEICHKQGQQTEVFVEVKVQRRAFMSVSLRLPESNLKPSETLALNLSDLLRYFNLAKQITTPIYVMWILAERPCILEGKKEKAYFQNIKILQDIYNIYGDKRRFRRKSGVGDVVNGVHKGVVVNYHFSINELLPFKINNLLGEN